MNGKPPDIARNIFLHMSYFQNPDLIYRDLIDSDETRRLFWASPCTKARGHSTLLSEWNPIPCSGTRAAGREKAGDNGAVSRVKWTSIGCPVWRLILPPAGRSVLEGPPCPVSDRPLIQRRLICLPELKPGILMCSFLLTDIWERNEIFRRCNFYTCRQS